MENNQIRPAFWRNYSGCVMGNRLEGVGETGEGNFLEDCDRNLHG